MITFLEKVIKLREPETEHQVDELIKYLGETPSIPLIERVLAHYKKEEKKILSEDLLEWMNENDQVEFVSEDGYKVSINTYVSSKVLDPETAFAWLVRNQYGDLIKDNLEFPKGELTKRAEEMLDALGLSYIKKSGIHPQSLKKIMSDRLKAGEELPDEDMGIKVSYYDECKVKEK